MANTFTCLRYHVVFSTKNRTPWLKESVRERLWPYMGGIATQNGTTPLEIGGVNDHAHLLLAIPARMAVSKAVQLIKGGSSHWLKGSFPELNQFAWQDGYGVFSVSESQRETVAEYIRNQEEHHRVKSFAEEYQLFLERHHVEFDERFLLG
jgi:putative transposase